MEQYRTNKVVGNITTDKIIGKLMITFEKPSIIFYDKVHTYDFLIVKFLSVKVYYRRLLRVINHKKPSVISFFIEWPKFLKCVSLDFV